MNIKRIQSVVDKICLGNFCENDVAMLFVLLRSRFSEDSKYPDEVLYDLSNFYCHNDARDRGNFHKVIKKYVEELVVFCMEGGTIAGTPVLSGKDVIDRLICSLIVCGIYFDSKQFEEQGSKLINYIKEYIDGTQIEFRFKTSINGVKTESKIPEIVNCVLRFNENRRCIDCRIQPNISGNVGVMKGNFWMVCPIFC